MDFEALSQLNCAEKSLWLVIMESELCSTGS